MKSVLSNRIYLNVDRDLKNKLLEELTFVIITKGQGGVEIQNKICLVTKVSSSIWSIPSGREDLIPKGYDIVDKRTDNPVDLECPGCWDIQLRKSQQDIYDVIDGSYRVLAMPGYGKTITALALARKFGQKTLVLTHNTVLREQWVTEIRKLMGFEAGTIGGGIEDNIEAPIVVANVQTYVGVKDKYKDTFGVVFVDEAHRLAATQMFESLDSSKAKIKITLTGSKTRKDGKHVIFPSMVSSKVVEPIDENTITPHYTVIKMLGKEAPSNKIWAKAITNLYLMDNFYEMVEAVTNELLRQGRVILLTTGRKDFAYMLAEEVDAEIITGDTPISDRNISIDKINKGECNILIGTTSILKEGLNIPRLDTLVITEPVSKNNELILQLTRRVLRKHPGKENALIVDFNIGRAWLKQLDIRIGFYLEKGYIPLNSNNKLSPNYT